MAGQDSPRVDPHDEVADVSATVVDNLRADTRLILEGRESLRT